MKKSLCVSSILLISTFSSLSATDYLELEGIKNNTSAAITVSVGNGAQYNTYDVAAGAYKKIDDFDISYYANGNKFVMVNNDKTNKEGFKTAWHSPGPYYTISDDDGYTSPHIGVYWFQAKAYCSLIIAKYDDNKYKYTWAAGSL